MMRFASLFFAAVLTVPAHASGNVAQPATPAPAPVKHTDDDRIYDEVRRKLANDVDVKGAGIDVAVKSGVVTLSGKVHTEKGKEKAEHIVKKIKGVTGVQNNLNVMESEK